MGMADLEKKVSYYPQLYSRIGFVHEYRPVSQEEMCYILSHYWHQVGLEFGEANFADEEALETVMQITGGNFRLVHRLLRQAQRILKVNRLTTMTREVLEAARECLVIGVK
jgi:DNA transposition AAA+ family ATPase